MFGRVAQDVTVHVIRGGMLSSFMLGWMSLGHVCMRSVQKGSKYSTACMVSGIVAGSGVGHGTCSAPEADHLVQHVHTTACRLLPDCFPWA